jgi:hypothetical protein
MPKNSEIGFFVLFSVVNGKTTNTDMTVARIEKIAMKEIKAVCRLSGPGVKTTLSPPAPCSLI